jgi:hypothetical protein
MRLPPSTTPASCRKLYVAPASPETDLSSCPSSVLPSVLSRLSNTPFNLLTSKPHITSSPDFNPRAIPSSSSSFSNRNHTINSGLQIFAYTGSSTPSHPALRTSSSTMNPRASTSSAPSATYQPIRTARHPSSTSSRSPPSVHSRKSSVTLVDPIREETKEKTGTTRKIGKGLMGVLGVCFYLLSLCCVIGGEENVKGKKRRGSAEKDGARIKKVEDHARPRAYRY